MRDKLDHAEKTRISVRARAVTVLFTIAFTAYLAVLWYVQVAQGESYRRLAESNVLRRVEMPPERGLIRDRGGRILVRNRPSFDIVLIRERLSGRDGLLPFLASTLGLPEETIRTRIEAGRGRPKHEPIVIGEDVGLGRAISVEARQLEWPELSVQTTTRRAYTEAALAAHVLGYVGEVSESDLQSGRYQPEVQAGDIVGKAGIERVYEDDLGGIKGYRQVVVNSRGRVVEEVGIDREPVAGRDLVLTLDLDLQRTLEEALAGQVGAAVFLEPWTGEVLAMASSPPFEPNLFAHRFAPAEWSALISNPLKPLQNRAALSRFSPGSTFKLVIAAAGLSEGVISGGTVISCGGAGSFYGHIFRCHKKDGHGPMDLEGAIVNSCNIYFYTVGQRLGIDRIAAYAHRLGLGEKTGIDLVAEDPGLIPTPDWKQATQHEPWYPGETISVSIGQGPLGVTVLQMASMAAVLANGGRHVTPHLRWHGREQEGRDEARARDESGFSSSTIAALRRAMAGVVNYGTGTRARIPGIQIAAKTGTAQFSSRSAGIDADQLPYDIRDHAWFVGFAPAESPRIAFAVFIEHGGHGGTTAAPVARRVLEQFFGVPPQEREAPPRALPPRRIAQEVAHAGAP